jgi:hypothetical protein
MTAVAPTGNGPFEFTNSNGSLVSIPLTAFSFDASGNLVVNTNWQAIAGAPPANALLAYARAQGLIVPAPAPSPKPAAIVKAVDPGPAGNNIAITILNVAANPDPTKTAFDIEVTEAENYTGLTATGIKSVLGSATSPGSQPGLVRILSVANPTGTPAALASTPLSGGSLTARSHLTVKDGSSADVFTLEARDVGSDGDLIHITITPAGSNFDLTAQWTKTATGATIGTIQALVASHLSFEITTAPPSGGIFSAPAAVTTKLSGGAGSTHASAILVAGQ